MGIELFTVKGPGGTCVMNKEQADAKAKLDGYSIVGAYVANAPAPVEKKPVVKEEDSEDSELLVELKGIRSNADLADFIEENEIEIDPSDYDGFKEIKEAVAKLLE